MSDIDKEFENLQQRHEYYPGTTTPIKPFEEREDENVVSTENEERDWKQLKGTTYTVKGELVTLYPIRVLAYALYRSPETVRKWERKGWLPRSKYNGPVQGGGGRRRLYSEGQIEAAVRIAREEGLLHYGNPAPTPTPEFTRRVKEAWTRDEL